MGNVREKLSSPAAARNRDPILDVLKVTLPREGTVLEIASGTGEHAIHFTGSLTPLLWQPSDPDRACRHSIQGWWWDVQLNNILPPLNLDVRDDPWPVETTPPEQPITSIVCINMIHISPWEATESLMRGAGRILPKGGILYLYGPYKENGEHTAPSNEAFDRSLKERNPEWGVRNLEDVVAEAEKNGLTLLRTVDMPANNLSVIFEKN
ncbi:DUF938 domain-containing protein [Emcibacter nanhaiensis]|uniref:DUF938 domain-containing protein n=1 Tax=Emcibacter nanhaiensis TaxID=1505037 RepID=A0A501PBJ1_9PROT|nr:DUF938 domain-containing protein [Emcibacter nanhaiensis]TPD57568.1 DUF938 domain-containing protein [Emcibacter nanhaiensis]